MDLESQTATRPGSSGGSGNGNGAGAGEPPSRGSSPQRESKKLARPIIRGAQACSQCRQHKIRCIPASPNHPFPCTRCTNQNLTCEVLKHNRGRKRKNAGDETPTPPAKQPAVYYPTDGVQQTREKPNGKGNTPRPTKAIPKINTSAVANQSTPAATTPGLPSSAGNASGDINNRSNLQILEEAIAMRGSSAPPGVAAAALALVSGQSHYQPATGNDATSSTSTSRNMAGSPPSPVSNDSRSPGAHNWQNPAASNSQMHNGQSLPQPTGASSSSNPPLTAQAMALPALPPPMPMNGSGGLISPSYQQQGNDSSSHYPYSNGSAGSSLARSSPYAPVRSHHYAPPGPTPLQSGMSVDPLQPNSATPYPPMSSSLYPSLGSQSMHGTSTVGSTSNTSYNTSQPAQNDTATNPQPLPGYYSQTDPGLRTYYENASGTLPMPTLGSLPKPRQSFTHQENSAQPPPQPDPTINSNAQSQVTRDQLDSLKFPFLIPRTERPRRKGLFSINSIVATPPGGESNVPPLTAESGAPSRKVPFEDTLEDELHPSSFNHPNEESEFLKNDPIDAGVISAHDAQTLYKLYMDEMVVMNCLLDPNVHTHDFVRRKSPFLYIAILSVISRYLNSATYVVDPITGVKKTKRLVSPIYSYCKKSSRIHLKNVLGGLEVSLEVVQGLAVLTYHKEPEDEKACLHLYRAIAIARELGIDQITLDGKKDVTEEEKTWVRIQQRVWKSLFVCNTILTMQFDMRTLIPPEDAGIAGSSRWAVGSNHPTDTLLITSIQLRRLWHIYNELVKTLDRNPTFSFPETPKEKASKLVSLSVITKTANRELEQCAADWKEECALAGVGRVDLKINVWLAAIKLKLNLTIVQMVLPGLKEKATWPDTSPPSKVPREPNLQSELGCTAAFHHSVNAACTILQSMTALEEKRLLSFAADTFLHFAIYSAFFLWTLCRDVGPELLEPGEVDHCFLLISNAARALESASLFPGDSPALHARFLRNLCQYGSSKYSGPNAPPTATPVYQTANNPLATQDEINTARSSHAMAKGMLTGAMREPNSMGNSSPNLNSDGSVPNNQQLDPVGRAQTTLNTINQNADMKSWGTSNFEPVLTADWTAMQKDFPWVFGDGGFSMMDNQMTQQTTLNAFPYV